MRPGTPTYDDDLDRRLGVFVVESFHGGACARLFLGVSPADGPTDTRDEDSGVVVRNAVRVADPEARRTAAVILAHEVGHYLGLSHGDDASDFVFAKRLAARTWRSRTDRRSRWRSTTSCCAMFPPEPGRRRSGRRGSPERPG